MASMMQPDQARAPNEGAPFRFSVADAVPVPKIRERADPTCARSLSKLIESEIIPRLVVAHAAATPQSAKVVGVSPDIAPAEATAFALLALQAEADTLFDHVEQVLARGVPVEDVLVNLLAPAARLLGEYWEDDRCDFIDVTMALWRLQEIAHEIGARAPGNRRRAEARRALFAPMPGDHHSFGTIVIDELFRREGWVTDRLVDACHADLLKRIADDWFDMIGLTINRDRDIGDLRATIAALRNVSRNPRVTVMVGGWIFSENPDLAVEVGADGTARDAKLALDVASRLVGERELEIMALG